jgi:hypothetical protein
MFERLTIKTDICIEPENEIVYHNPNDPEGMYNILDLAECLYSGGEAEAGILMEISRRLAAYEDSQMTPEEVQSLAQAKADGRLVVLPCKVGTVVYAHSSVAGYDSIISGIVQYFVVHEQFIDLFVLFKPNPNEDKHDFAEYIRADKIGKTVFLTREAAEKALEVGE